MLRIVLAWTVWIAVVTGGGAPTVGDEPPSLPIDPDEAVRLALKHHPRLAGAEQELRAAEAERELAHSGHLPRIELVEEIARSNNPVFVFASKLGQQRFATTDFDVDTLNRPDPLNNFATRLTVRQNVWDADRTRLGRKAASIGIDAAEAARMRAEDEVAFGALEAFWNLVTADAMLEVARDAETAAQANLALATELVDAGLAVPSDRMSAETRLAEVRAQRIRAVEGRDVAQAAFLFATGLDEGGPFRAIPPDEPEPPEDDLAHRIATALASRSDLRALDERIRQADLGVRIARGGRLPEIGAVAGYEWNGESLLGTNGDNWSVGVGLRLSLFDGGETRARTAVARAGLSQMEAVREQLRQGVRLQVRSAWAGRSAARQRLAVAEAALQQSAEALRVVRERYAEGLAVMVELLVADAAHTQARANLETAQGDLWLARSVLDLATGIRLGGAAPAPGGTGDGGTE